MQLWFLWYLATRHRRKTMYSILHQALHSLASILLVFFAIVSAWQGCVVRWMFLFFGLLVLCIGTTGVFMTNWPLLPTDPTSPPPTRLHRPTCLFVALISGFYDTVLIVGGIWNLSTSSLHLSSICSALDWVNLLYYMFAVFFLVGGIVYEVCSEVYDQRDCEAIDETTVEDDDDEQSSGETRQCAICLRSLKKGRTRTLACTHTFHRRCIREWFRRSFPHGRRCPYCQAPSSP